MRNSLNNKLVGVYTFYRIAEIFEEFNFQNFEIRSQAFFKIAK